MELALSLGDTPKPFSFLDKPQKKNNSVVDKDHLGFCMAVGKDDEIYDSSKAIGSKLEDDRRKVSCSSSPDPPVQLDLLPLCPPVHRSHQSTSSKKFPNFHWLNENFVGQPERAEDSSPNSTTVSSFHRMDSARFMKGKRGFEGIVGEERAEDSSPNSTTVSSFHRMDSARFMKGKRGFEGIVGNVNGGEADRGRSYSRGIISYEEETNNVNGDHDINMGRKKLRLSKEQSAFLEESFKEHSTLNPKQKFALAKQLNLHTRQVEVWFQNRRARTKLKQTELDCEHLKRCFETLTEENKRLQKELQELRALKASKPFYMQLPATTLTMCPSCERVAATTTGTADTLATTTTAAAGSKPTKTHSISPPRTNGQQADHS